MIHLLDESDLDWVATMIDVVERHAGEPWRVALDHLDDFQRAAQPATARRFTAVVGALQRLVGGRQRNARIARRARGLVLGHPVLVPAERQARIDHAALMLGTSSESVELMLWSDLPRERPIQLPTGRPSELEVAAFANVALLQRAVRRAQSIRLTVHDDDPGHVVRAAALRGLLVTASRKPAVDDPAERLLGIAPAAPARAGTVIDIAGPLSLCHRTSVYGRALADLVPLLADLRDWSLEVRVELPLASYTTHVASPALLPPPPARLTATPAPLARIVRGLHKLSPTLRARPLPPAICAGTAMLWPDLEIDDGSNGGRRIYIELVGFWTREYVDARLAAYRALGLDAVVCVDTARAAGDNHALPPEVLAYTKLVPVEELLARLQPS